MSSVGVPSAAPAIDAAGIAAEVIDVSGLGSALSLAAAHRDAADDGVDGLRTALRAALSKADAAFTERFLGGTPARLLVAARTDYVDLLLLGMWRFFFNHPAQPQESRQLALVAVGGYGRGELHPGSDVDIMLLADEPTIGRLRQPLERFLTLLWDIGLEVGQSVRTLADCARESEKDVTVLTNLTEARLLAGSEALFARLREHIAPDKIWPNREFFEAKKEEQKRRYRRYDETAYNLEPNVKEGSGGLRDLQTIAWVAKRYFNAGSLSDLVGHGFLTAQERDELVRCRDFLWQVRFGLHVLTGRREDRLLFEHQRELARLFGYRDHEGDLAVEQLMQRYYRTVMSIGRLNEMLLQLFEEAILLVDDPAEPVPINRRFQSRKGFLEVTHEHCFRRNPFALLELFLVLQQQLELKGVRASTVRLVYDSLPLIDHRFRADVRARSLFMEILRQPERVTRSLRRMNRYGVLGAYLPEFGAIVGRMQYDLFHVYTVDQHTLFLVRNLRRLDLPRFSHESPHASAVMQRIPKPELLYVAALYHDIAKGRGGDHSELGARDVEDFCGRHGLGRFDTELARWLVLHHLKMSLTAQKKDVHDPDVLTEFGRFCGDQLHLDYLYLLTVADIRATNPKLWNTWREALLRQLYEGTRQALRRGLDHPQDRDERRAQIQTEATEKLARLGIDRQRAERIWRQHSDDYFLRYATDEIVWHTRAMLKKADDDRALVLIREDPLRGGTEVFIYMRDIGGIFATVAAALDRLGLSVHDARIVTGANGYILDSFTVLDGAGRPIDSRRCKEIARSLRLQLNRPEQRRLDSARQVPRVLKQFNTPTSISFDQDVSSGLSLLEIIAADRPGLLSRIGRAFMDCDIRLHKAKIATIGERAEDLFYISDSDGRPLTDAAAQQRLEIALRRHVDQPDENSGHHESIR